MGTRAGLDVLDVPVLGIEILYAGPAARALVAVLTELSRSDAGEILVA